MALTSKRVDWVLDADIEGFFDNIDHAWLMKFLEHRIGDRRILRLIRKWLTAGVSEEGEWSATTVGTPQGAVISPLLANVCLHYVLDLWVEWWRKHRCRGDVVIVRYADDCNIYVRSRRAGLRVMKSMVEFIEGKLKLKVNEQKSAVDRPWRRKFLGFSFTSHKANPRIRISKESIKRFKQRVKELTSRKKSMNMKDRIEKLNRYLVGWLGYYQLAETPSIFGNLDGWIRRRLRMIRWKEWKQVKTKYKNLMKLGINKGKAWEWANSRKAYWRIAKSPILSRALGNKYWSRQGLKRLLQRYQTIRWT